MVWLLLPVPLLITYYTFTYGLWAWNTGNRGGAAGVFIIAAFSLALSIYALFIRSWY